MEISSEAKMQNSFGKITFTNSNFYKKKNMGSCADGTENFGRLVSVPKKLLLLFPEKEPFP